jgi:uncharacterized protein YbjT (DUF2867 family)
VILVAGGTGSLGTRVVRRLVSRGERVRVLTRDRNRAAQLEAEVVEGDVRDPGRAVEGCTTVVSAVHGFAGPGRPSPEAIDRNGNLALIEAAKRACVRHFVLVSVHGAAADHPMSLHRAKYAAEVALRESGLAFTILRPTAFLETWTALIGGTLHDKGYALVFGPGKNPINFVPVDEVAARVVRAVCEPPHGEVVELGGPEDLSFVALAERIIARSGRPGRIKHIPLAVLRALSLLARPFSPGFARKAAAAVVMNTTNMSFEQPR